MKKLRMLLTLFVVSVCSWQSAWADDVIANVTLKETNSLSSEILAINGINDVKTVTNLTVTTNPGIQLGDDDWTTLKSMTALQVLDLSNASADAVPDNQFYYENCPNLVTVKLPNGLKTIGASAFSSKKNLVKVEVPNTVTSIGSSAFYGCSKLETCDISECNLTAIPSSCFDGCSTLTSFTIPSTVTTIEYYAFSSCSLFTSTLPAGLKSIGRGAFRGAAMTGIDVVIPEGCEVDYYMFESTNISSIEFPTTYYKFNDCIGYCSNLQTVTLKSPTVVENAYVYNNASSITLKVPSHLISLYKSDPEWSKYTNTVAIEPAVTSYTVSTDLRLSNSSVRMTGTPSIFNKYASLSIYGEAAQDFNNYTACSSIYSSPSSSSSYFSMILNESANVTVNGAFKERIYTQYKKRWLFLCMPFDFVVGDVTAESGSFVIRTYDGAKRNTANANSGNWSGNLGADVEIKAGTGFILQTSEETWVTFTAKAAGTNHAFKKKSDIVQTPLAANNSNTEASAANTGWNMVGNPWQTYYNIHNMDYTAPFAVYDGYSYTTYSPDDDDFALAPFEAIFVQCPNGVTTIDFPGNGRQLTREVTSQNPARKVAKGDRQLFDIQIASGELNDKTRLVVNANATMDYEIGRDASKFFANGTATPQIYSLDTEGTQYAINERPADNGTMKLGILFAADGEYTLSAIRNDIGEVILADHKTGIKTNLQQNDYSFEAEAGTDNTRFSLSFGKGTTGITTAKNSEVAEKEVYTLDGIRMGNTTDGLKKGVYVVRQGQKTQKVIIK